jgi:carboxyvinyl-carboxyphosphonate phosphorylmutase
VASISRWSERRDPSLVIAGRTSAAAITGIEDTIARAEAYQASGDAG